MSAASSPQSEPPEGYKTFLVNAAKREKAEEEFMYRVLRDGLQMEKASLIEQTTLRRAAKHALLSLEHGGFELSLAENGDLRYVTT
jgi:hypothetical protein